MAERQGLFARIRKAFKEPEEDKEAIEKAKKEGEELAEQLASIYGAENFRKSQKVEIDTSSPIEVTPREQEEQER